MTDGHKYEDASKAGASVTTQNLAFWDMSLDSAPDWIPVGPLEDIPEGEAVVTETEPPIAVFKINGRLLAIDDTCTHAKASLSAGFVEGDTVECDLHFAKFSLATGEALTRPATVPVHTHEVRVIDGCAFVNTSNRGSNEG